MPDLSMAAVLTKRFAITSDKGIEHFLILPDSTLKV